MMLFKDIKQNFPVYILDKQNMSFTQGKVQSVSFPHIDNSSPMGMGKTVIDVAIEADGKSGTYAMPENLSVVYAGNVVLSTDRDGIMREVEAMKASAEQVIASINKQKEIVEKSTKLLTELNPEYKAKQENEQRLSNLENSMREFQSSMKDLKEMMSGFIKDMKG